MAGAKSEFVRLMLYDHDGQLLWTRPLFEETTYPGDSRNGPESMAVPYDAGYLVPIVVDKQDACILTTAYASYPARMQIMLYDKNGQKISGPYIHTGHDNRVVARSVDVNQDGNDEVVIGVYNRRCKQAALLILDPTNMGGVNPPYDNELFLNSGMPKGTQKYYILFPQIEFLRGNDATCDVGHFYPIDSNTYSVGISYNGVFSYRGNTISYGSPYGPIALDYIFDRNFIPIGIWHPDHTMEKINGLLRQMGEDTITDPERWIENLKLNVIVYHGDSIVHHLSAGIDFYRQH